MNSSRMLAVSTALGAAVLLGGCSAETGEFDESMDETAELGEVTEALASDCENGKNGFIDISDSLSGTNAVAPRDLGAGVKVSLQYGTVAGAQRGWAKISGATVPGDTVRMEWRSGGVLRVNCGPFTVGSANASKTSAAKKTSADPTYQFRACGAGSGLNSGCTAWW